MITSEFIRKMAQHIPDHGVLVGTAGLMLHGFKVEPHDIDFLVETGPNIKSLPYAFVEQGSGPEGSVHVITEGINTDYIVADEDRQRFMSVNPVLIDGILVATIDDILGLKKFAGRSKDNDFLRQFYAGQFTP